MREGLLPLFPLQLVLFPRTRAPLHIFEERYKEMIGGRLAGGGEFGVVLAQGQGILRTGCSASIETVVKRYEDGRLDIVVLGTRRFQIEAVDSERSFLRAEVEFFEDVEDGPADRESLRRAVAANSELRKLSGEEESEPDLHDPQASFQLAQVTPDLGFRQTLLTMRSEPDRMTRVADHLEKLLAAQRVQDQMRKISRGNGHSRLPVDPGSRN